MSMKTIKIFALLLTLMTFVGCSEDSLSSKSVIVDPKVDQNDFDKWLFNNYTDVYNIDFKYKLEDIESDMNYHLTPARYDKSIILSKLVKYLCIEAYDEVTESTTFIRTYFPKIICLVGSAAYRNNGTMVLGTAEGGKKITLYLVNNVDVTDMNILNEYYFQTIHHEFVHILHQTKPYSTVFNEISASKYVGDSWNQSTDKAALMKGFITPYASSAVDEDFAELMSMFLTLEPAEWEFRLNIAALEDSDGRSIIEEKFDILKNYLSESWEIDIYQLRDIIAERFTHLQDMDYSLDN